MHIEPLHQFGGGHDDIKFNFMKDVSEKKSCCPLKRYFHLIAIRNHKVEKGIQLIRIKKTNQSEGLIQPGSRV